MGGKRKADEHAEPGRTQHGAGKGEGDDKDKDQRTVFARGVSFTLSEADLEAKFTDIGPVRKCFLVRSKGEERHRGFGFIQFALAEDAERAVAELNGKEVAGKKLQLEIATKKAPLDQRYPKKAKVAPEGEEGAAPPAEAEPAEPVIAAPAPKEPKAKPVKPAPVHPREKGGVDTQKGARTVAVGNLPADKTALEAAMRMIKSIGPVEEVQDPAPKSECDKAKLFGDGCKGHVVFVVYKQGKDAAAAVKKLHRHVIAVKGSKDAGEPLWARSVGGEGSHVKKWRLIVRNLPFNLSEGEMKEHFSKAGFVWESSVPKKPDGKMRGFGFVAFTCKSDAEKAIQLFNGSSLKNRPIAVDWAVARSEYEQMAKDGGAAAAAPAAVEKKEEAAPEKEPAKDESESEGEDGEDSEEEMGMSDSEDDMEGLEEVEDDEEEDEEEEEEPAEMKKEMSLMQKIAAQMIESEKKASEKEKEAQKDEKKDKEKKKEEKPAKPKEDGSNKKENYEGKRANDGGDPSTSGPEKKSFNRPDQGVLPSTVFIRNLPLDASQFGLKMRLETFGKVRSCRLVTDKATGKCKGTAFADFEKPESAAKIAEASTKAKKGQGPPIVVQGSEITVDIALSKESARDLAQEKSEGKKREKDKRNAYLAEEGRIEPGTSAYDQLSEGDKAKRERAYKDKKMKLQSPNFIVSRTRLSIRNIPKSWDEEKLRACCVEAVKKRATKAKPRVKQVKILKEEEGGKKASDGAPKSKGLGFIEFDDHEHALCCLRELNNHPMVFNSKDRRPIVEFAMENVKIIKKRDHLLTLAKERAQKDAKTKRESGELPKKKSRSARRDERKRREREAAAAAAAGGEGAPVPVPAAAPAGEAGRKPAAQGKKGGRAALKQTAKALEEAAKSAKEKAFRNKRQRAEQEEERVAGEAKRRRTEEQELERVAAKALEGGKESDVSRKGNKKSRAAKKRGETDKLDSLVEDYTRRIFGGAAADEGKGKGKGKKAAAPAAQKDIKRWFE